MNSLFRLCLIYCIFFGLFPSEGAPQAPVDQSSGQKASAREDLFGSDEVFEITLSGDLRNLLKERTGKATYHSVVLSVNGKDGKEIRMPVEAKTRGHFRRRKENCAYPPLYIRFPKKGIHRETIFRNQRKIKLVMPCIQDDYVIREWLVYKLYSLLTPSSYRARLVKITLADDQKKRPSGPYFAVFLEEEKQLADRNKASIVERKLKPQMLQQDPFFTLCVFEYLVGNTDWSVEFLHNISLLAGTKNGTPLAVPYDFDHAGIVNTPYAMPASELRLASVRERRYRGYCVQDPEDKFRSVIKKFNNLRQEIYKLYADCEWLDEKYKRSTIKYLDEFYSTINDDKAWQEAFSYPCKLGGTGNVIISGFQDKLLFPFLVFLLPEVIDRDDGAQW